MTQTHITREGFEKLQKEYQDLLSQRPHAVSELKRAREMGDLSENGFYKGARMKLSDIDRRLRQLQRLIKSAKIVDKTSSGIVDIGSRVTVLVNNEEKTLMIVGSYESDPLKGKISHISPIGKALMGKRVGEKVMIEIPSGKITYMVVQVG